MRIKKRMTQKIKARGCGKKDEKDNGESKGGNTKRIKNEHTRERERGRVIEKNKP